MAKHGLKWNVFSAENINFLLGYEKYIKILQEMLYILSALKFAGSLLAFHGGNVHFFLIPPKFFSLGLRHFNFHNLWFLYNMDQGKSNLSLYQPVMKVPDILTKLVIPKVPISSWFWKSFDYVKFLKIYFTNGLDWLRI